SLSTVFHTTKEAAAFRQRAIAVSPKGPCAESSSQWIRFLADRTIRPTSAEKPNEALAVMKGLVRIWLGQQHAANASVTLRSGDTLKNPGLAVHTLRQRIRSRDK